VLLYLVGWGDGEGLGMSPNTRGAFRVRYSDFGGKSQFDGCHSQCFVDCLCFSALFVDIGDNVSVVDRVKLSYNYDEIDTSEVSAYISIH
jgi:hypothetical protein